MLERLSNPTPRTLRSESRGYTGYPSPCSTMGSLKQGLQYTRQPPDDMPLNDAQYVSVPTLAQETCLRGQSDAPPGPPPAQDEITPFLAHADHRESSDSSDLENFMSRTSCSTSQETVINMADVRLSTQF